MKKFIFYIFEILSIMLTFLYIISVFKIKSFLPVILILFIIQTILFLVSKEYNEGIKKNIMLKTWISNVCIVIFSAIYEIFFRIYSGMSSFIIETAHKTEGITGYKLSQEAILENIARADERVLELQVTLIIGMAIIDIGFIIFLIYQLKTNELFSSSLQNIENITLENFDIKKILKLKKEEIPESDVPDIVVCKDPKTGKPIIQPHKDRYLHYLILGPTGSGKTSQTIIPFINQDMQKNCGITVIEPKGDLAEKVWALGETYGRKVVYFNPVLDNCPYFNPLHGKEEEVVENMSTTFKMLNPDSPQFFLDQNDNLVRNALKVLKRLEEKGQADANLINLNRLIYNTNGQGRKLVIAFSKLNCDSEDIKKENDDLAGWFLDDYYKEKSKTYEHCSSLRSQVSKIISNKYLRRVLNPPSGINDVDFNKHLAEGGVIAISTAQGDLRDLGKYLGYFIILQFQSAVFKRPGNENTRLAHMLYIDEFQEFSNPGFGMMLTQGRSYRVASHLATQNRDLMAMGGGKDGQNFVRLVDTNARNLIIYPGGNFGDADYYSRKFGEISEIVDNERTVARKGAIGLKTDVDRTVTTELKSKARFTPTDIMYRPFGEITYSLIIKNSIQPPGIGTIEYIPSNLNAKLDTMIDDLKEGRIQQSILQNSNTENYISIKEKIEIKNQDGVPYNIEVRKKEKIEIPDEDFFGTDTMLDDNGIEFEDDNGIEFEDDNGIEFEYKKEKTNLNNNSISIKGSNKNTSKNTFIEEDDDDSDDLF